MIELKDICKSFGDHVILNNFSETINDGEYVIFTGKSGCGKTTLLNTIGGLEKPDSGYVLIDGVDIYKTKNMEHYFKEKVGFLFQNFALVENKSVSQNLELVQKKQRTGVSISNALEQVGLKDKGDMSVYKLSGGEQQRVALARLIIKKCDIILADEPTGSLDRENASMVLEFLKKLAGQGKTVIIVTHDEKVMETAERVIKL